MWPFLHLVCFLAMSGGDDQERAAKVPATEDSVVAKAAGAPPATYMASSSDALSAFTAIVPVVSLDAGDAQVAMGSAIVLRGGATSAGPYRFRIGVEKYGYVYQRVLDDVWRCSRASDNVGQRADYKLFLVQDDDGYWYAIDALSTLSQKAAILLQGHRVFRTQENALLEGSHFWDSNSGLFG